MKILQVHNEYQHSGGEEAVVDAEYRMLNHYGHEVKQWIVKNSVLDDLGLVDKVKLSFQSTWSQDAYIKLQQKIGDFRPDIVHVHNTIPLISASIYSACHDCNVPVVQTLHNYKFICPGSNLYRNESICEDCIDKSFTYPALINSCYRRSTISTIFAVQGLTFHRLRGTYENDIDAYIALTEFARQKFIQGGLPAEKIAVKPNFVNSDIRVGEHKGNYALFAGRLIPQKGVKTLLKAWHLLDDSIPLKVVGRGVLESLFHHDLPPGIEYLGAVPRHQVIELMQNARLLIFPSEWYECFPMAIAEAFATGLPVIASNLGGMGEIIQDGKSGWHFQVGDPKDLARVVQSAWSDPVEIQRRGSLARHQYETDYSLEKNHQVLISIYQKAIDSWRKKVNAGALKDTEYRRKEQINKVKN
ncbi:glycosyltransferase [Calothrix sp. NIES-3974]|uniref:glycosyltransferase n=1 Tax=Calothrix sp. NIES-3974 TaxID=2005462 RepID=UPI000B5FD180|nr:glycosyltransferase [Calothrix sp. NIES-3974]BAZ03879.1 group 1 glycosyl transferase [Calothrix sp. NIES-3974]